MAKGPEFLHRKDSRLHTSPAVTRTQKRLRIGQKPADKIEAHLKRIWDMMDPDNPKSARNRQILMRRLHKSVITKPEDIPQSYYDNQRRLAREQGHGDVQITREMKRQAAYVITTDQKSSLEKWADYLTSRDSNHLPPWAKYWAFTGMLKLSSYDKEKKRFRTRDAGTVAPFPDLDREALAVAVDSLVKKVEGKPLPENLDSPEFRRLLQGANFGKVYAHAIEKVTPAEENELLTTKGKWVRYPQGSDHMPLVSSLQGHGTGWCTAGESTARTHLQGGDFHVFYSHDKLGRPAVPRASIRMEGGRIAEIRGIAHEQNLDPHITSVVEKKLSQFPDGPAYKKRVRDMKRLTEIERKNTEGKRLTKDDLRFLYEIHGKIDGFGYEKDPRIAEIRGGRDQREDYSRIFGCRPEKVALTPEELGQETIAYAGDLDISNLKVTELPKALAHVGGDLHLWRSKVTRHGPEHLNLKDSQVTELPDSLALVGGSLYLGGTRVTELPENIQKIVKGTIIR